MSLFWRRIHATTQPVDFFNRLLRRDPTSRLAILAAAVPTGAGSYILARQLGGDAPLMAAILTAQVAAAAVTLPLVVAFVV